MQGRALILPAAGSCKIERPEKDEGVVLRVISGHSILKPPVAGKIGECRLTPRVILELDK